MYSAQSEGGLLGMCSDYPRIACYSKLNVIMWNVSEPLRLFADVYTKSLSIYRATAYPRRPKILALGEVSIEFQSCRQVEKPYHQFLYV